jgi:PAS domain S-box-containing protein
VTTSSDGNPTDADARVEARFFDLTLDLLAVAGFDGTFRRANTAWTRVLGWPADELVGTPYAALFHPDDLDANVDLLNRLATGADTVSFEARLRGRDGRYRWMLGSVRADVDAGCIYMAVKDIDERRADHERLRAAEADLRFQVDLEGLVTAMSTEFLGVHEEELPEVVERSLGDLARYFGLDRAYVLKTAADGFGIELFVEWWADGVSRDTKPIPELPKDAQRFWVRSLRNGLSVHVPDVHEPPRILDEVTTNAAMAELIDQGVQSILFLPLVAREQRIAGFMGLEARRQRCWWSDESIGLMRTVGELVVGAVERCAAEGALARTAAELERRNDELERSNKELEQFASIVSHDLKSPLQVVRGFVELLGRLAESNPESPPEVETYVGAALRGAARMDRLIDDLLAYSRAGQRPAELVPIRLRDTMNEVLADSAATIADADAKITVGELPTVRGDSTQLRQLLQNLVMNAIKFRRPDVPVVVSITGRDVGDAWQIDVTDNGIGIGPEHREEIFAMFTRLGHGDRPGSGIGLAICARVVANHGGTIWVTDGDDGGSRLCFTIAKDSTHRG